MDFQTFCSNNQLFQININNNENNNIALTKCFYADCYLNMSLNLLLHEPSSTAIINPEWEADLIPAFGQLFLHFPVCNFTEKENEISPKFKFDKKSAISNCSKWFSILYNHNPELCCRLFPVISFILGDSYEYIKTKYRPSKQKEFSIWLYDFIKDNLLGKYQMSYLFSLLEGSITKKCSCITHGSNAIESLEKQEICFIMYPHGSMQPPEITDEEKPKNIIDYNAKHFLNLLNKCKIRNNLSSYRSGRTNYPTEAVMSSKTINAEDTKTPLLGENFIAFLLYLQDFDVNIPQNNHWAEYDHSLTMYTISQMTQWITPFTTQTTFCIMPAFNALHPLTCNYFNSHLMHSLNVENNPRFKCIDFERVFNTPIPATISDFKEFYKNVDAISISEFSDYFKKIFLTKETLELTKDGKTVSMEVTDYFQEEYKLLLSNFTAFFKDKETISITEFTNFFQDADDYLVSNFITIFKETGLYVKRTIPYIHESYTKLQSWYKNSADSEKQSFRSFLHDTASALFDDFIQCKTDAVFLPTKRDLCKTSKYSPWLGYFYCLCDNIASGYISNPALP